MARKGRILGFCGVRSPRAAPASVGPLEDTWGPPGAVSWQATDKPGKPPSAGLALRHSFATALLAKGVDLRTVQDLMRHKTAAMTMRYAHSTSERRRAAVEKVLA